MVTRARRLPLAAWLALIAGLAFSIPAAAQSPDFQYATYLGSSGWDEGLSIAAGPDGTAYIAGTTRYPTDFLELTAPAEGPPPVEDRTGLFVLALNASGELLYLTYITTFEDPWKPEAQDIAVAPDGTVSLSFTLSRPGKSFVYLTRVSPAGWQTGAQLLAGFRAGAGGLAVDARGNAYIGVHNDVFTGSSSNRLFSVFKVAPDQSTIYRVDLAASGQDEVTDLSIDATGRVFFTGFTSLPGLATPGAFQSTLAGGEDAFLAEIDPAGHLDSFTYLGGSGDDRASALAVDAEGNLFMTGVTTSPDFPLASPVQPPPSASNPHFFLSRLNAAGDRVSSTYVGPDPWSTPRPPTVALGPGGDLFWMGLTPNIPPWDPEAYFCEGTSVLRFDPDSLDLLGDFCYFTAIAADLDIDPDGNLYFTGLVREDFSPSPGALQPFFAGRIDAFAARLRLNRPPDCSNAQPSPNLLWPPNGRLVSVALQNLTDPDGDPVTLKITGIRQDEPLSRQGEADATGIGAPFVTLRADRSGFGDGRVYHIAFEARDDQGATCSATVNVCVPHDQRPGASCRDGGPLFDSTRLALPV